MGVVNTTYTFSGTDTITSSKLNNIIDDTTFTSDAIIGTTLAIASGKLKINSQGITSNEMGVGSVNPSATTFADSLLPSGAVMPFARSSAPSGWLAADGSSISTGGANSALFAAIGYSYGGSGGSFNLPDLRGYFVRGSGTNSDSTASGAFGQKQASSLLDHTHSGVTSVESVGHAHNYVRYNSVVNNVRADGGNNNNMLQGTTTVASDGISANHTHSFTTGNPSAGGGTETRPANIALLYCIKL